MFCFGGYRSMSMGKFYVYLILFALLIAIKFDQEFVLLEMSS